MSETPVDSPLPAAAREPALHFPRIEKIDKFHFDIVHGCQLRCVGCPNSTLQPKVKRIEVEDFDFLLSRVDVRHVAYLRLFSFGEPLLHRNLSGILECIPRQSWSVGRIEISTNAQFVDWDDLEAALKTRILTHISVSCDGNGTPEEYERLRPPSRWDRFIEFLERTYELRERYCPEMELMTRTICTDPAAQARWRGVLEPRGWEPEFRGWLYLPEAERNMTGKAVVSPPRVCTFQAVHNRLYVDWDGTVVPCCAHPRAGVLGNLRDNTFNEIMHARARAEFIVQDADRPHIDADLQRVRLLGWLKGPAGAAGNPVVERIAANAKGCDGGAFLTLIARDGTEKNLSYSELVASAERWVRRYRRAGLAAGAVVIVILEHGEALYSAYVGALLGGFRPAYFAHPSEKVDASRYRESLRILLATVGGEAIVTSRSILNRIEGELAGAAVLFDDGEIFAKGRGGGVRPPTCADALFIQFSSGTTGIKKGVPISADMLVRQIAAYTRQIGAGPTDRIASWLPLYHDMGLIACFFLPLLERIPVAAMSAFDWVKRPEMLLEAITRHRATLVWLPNFAYNFLASRTVPVRAGAWDLSSVRAVVNCSEPVQHRSHAALLEKLAPHGLRASALSTCYALAENTFAVTSGGIDRPLALETVDANGLVPGVRVASVEAGRAGARTLVGSGAALAETRVSIVDSNGNVLPDGTVGEIEIASPSLFAGYVAADESVSGLRDGRFPTGDLGYLRGGELYVIGRMRDTIIVGGRNVQPQDVEAIVEGVDGVVPGRCVAVGADDDALGTQSLTILAETRVEDTAERRRLRAKIRDAVIGGLDLVPADVALFDHMWLQKSTSGKLARRANLERYLAGLQPAGAPRSTAAGEPSRVEAVSACVTEAVLAGAAREAPDFGPQTDLLREGVLDSFSLVGFHLMLEDRFGVGAVRAIREAPEAFASVEAIVEALEEYEGQAASRPAGARAQARAAADAQSVRYRLAPQMRDVEAQPYEWVAYLMRRGAPNYRSSTLNSDEHGLRMTYRDGVALRHDEWETQSGRTAVTLGNSFAYGIGTTHDTHTFTSRLNARPDTRGLVWSNLSQRASVLTQERLAFELHAPAATRAVVWVSGINNLVSLVVGEGRPRNPVPFVGERQYTARMMPDVRYDAPPAFESRYAAMIRQIEVDFSAVALRLGGEARFVFCLQPSASWIDKRWTTEELELIEIFDAGAALQQAHHPRHLKPLHARFAADLAGICSRWGIAFVDANADPALCEERWFFLDRIHMTDAGHETLAALIARSLSEPRAVASAD